MVGVKTGALNFPKMLRHLQHRTNQVKDLTFLSARVKFFCNFTNCSSLVLTLILIPYSAAIYSTQ